MEVASITIAQALLLGFFWWFKTNYYGQTFTCFISNSCLTAALFVGIVLGDIPNAMIIGASVQLIYLGILGPGGNLPQDPVLATLVSTAIVLKSGMPVETAFCDRGSGWNSGSTDFKPYSTDQHYMDSYG